MNLNEYQNQATTLAVYPKQYNIAYPALGLVDEVGELLRTQKDDQDAIIKEMGDCIWYCAALSYDLELALQGCYDNAEIQAISDVEALFYNSTILSGRVKKILRGDSGDKIKEIKGLIGDILRRIEALASPITLEEICQRNLNKLFSRKDRGVLKGDGDDR